MGSPRGKGRRIMSDRLAMGLHLTHCYPQRPGEEQDTTMVEMEQASVREDNASLTFTQGTHVFSLCFLDSKALDKLSLFLAEAAQRLRCCTR